MTSEIDFNEVEQKGKRLAEIIAANSEIKATDFAESTDFEERIRPSFSARLNDARIGSASWRKGFIGCGSDKEQRTYCRFFLFIVGPDGM